MSRGATAGPRFPCARCGRPLIRTRNERPRKIRCPRCRFLIYDYPRICAGMLVLKGDSVLLLRRGHTPRKGCVDIPGGFMDAGETIEAAARRELREETGLRLGKVAPLGSWWDRYLLPGFGAFPTLNFYYWGRWRSGTPAPAIRSVPRPAPNAPERAGCSPGWESEHWERLRPCISWAVPRPPPA